MIKSMFLVYVSLITGIWAIFSFPERLLNREALVSIADSIAPPQTKPEFQRLFSTIIDVGQSVFKFRQVTSLSLFLPSICRLILIHIFSSLIIAIYFTLAYLHVRPIATFLTADVPVIALIMLASSIIVLPFEYLSTTFTRLVLDEAVKGGRVSTITSFIADITFKVSLVLWLNWALYGALPKVSRGLIHGWYKILPSAEHLPWVIAAMAELLQTTYLPFYILVVTSISSSILLIWGAAFVTVVFLFSGLGDRSALFRLIRKYGALQRRPLSLMGFFLMLAVTPVYVTVCTGIFLLKLLD